MRFQNETENRKKINVHRHKQGCHRKYFALLNEGISYVAKVKIIFKAHTLPKIKQNYNYVATVTCPAQVLLTHIQLQLCHA